MTRDFDYALYQVGMTFRGITDRGGDLAIKHALAVWSRVRLESEEVQITALLHDVVEDTDWTIKMVKDEFGPTIADAVDAISRRDGEMYWDYIKRCSQNEIAKKVKIADLMENSSPGRLNKLPEKERGVINRYNKALMFLRALEKTDEALSRN